MKSIYSITICIVCILVLIWGIQASSPNENEAERDADHVRNTRALSGLFELINNRMAEGGKGDNAAPGGTGGGGGGDKIKKFMSKLMSAMGSKEKKGKAKSKGKGKGKGGEDPTEES